MKVTFQVRELGIFLALVLLFVFFSFATPHFFNAGNLLNIIRQVSLIGILAMGMTMVIVTGEIDLSVGAIYGAAAIVGGFAMTQGLPVWLAVVAALLTGLVFGLLNGVLATYGRIPALIVTLGMMNVARGFALVLSGARVIALSKRTVDASGLDRFLCAEASRGLDRGGGRDRLGQELLRLGQRRQPGDGGGYEAAHSGRERSVRCQGFGQGQYPREVRRPAGNRGRTLRHQFRDRDPRGQAR